MGGLSLLNKKIYMDRRGYTKDAVRGFSWIGSFRISSRMISFLRTILIARILSPAQFGVFGITAFVLSFAEIITETGINILLIQEKGNVKSYFNTAFVISVIRGFIISVLILISAPFIANFFNNEDLIPLLQLVSFVPFIRGFINPAVILFLKNLDYKREFY